MATLGSMCLRSANRIVNISRQSSILRYNNLRNSRLLTTESNGKTNQAEVPPPENQEKTEKETGPSELELKLKEENSKLTESLKDTKDKYLRTLAETENVRNRMKKQVDDSRLFGIQGFCKDLLEVADILEKAIEVVPKDELKKQNTHLVSLFEGLTMTSTQLQKVFSKHGLEQILPEEGEKFDPFVHEALFQVPSSDKEVDATVAVLSKNGYKLHDRTIRPALVGVFKA